MSAGSQIIPVRLAAELLDDMDEAIAAANCSRRAEPYTRSSWLRAVVREKLAKLERGRRPRKKKDGAQE
jgi:hypothetical protein